LQWLSHLFYFLAVGFICVLDQYDGNIGFEVLELTLSLADVVFYSSLVHEFTLYNVFPFPFLLNSKKNYHTTAPGGLGRGCAGEIVQNAGKKSREIKDFRHARRE